MGKDNLTFEGTETTWEKLPALLEKVPNRGQTVLEVAMASDDMSVRLRDEADGNAIRMARRFGFEYLSYVGVHPLGSKGGPSQKVAPPAKKQNAKQPNAEAAVGMMEPLRRQRSSEFRRALEANDLKTASKDHGRARMPRVDEWLALLKGSPAEPMASAPRLKT